MDVCIIVTYIDNDVIVCRYKFIVALSKGIRSPFQMFSWKPGGSRAGEAVHVLWRIPRSPADRNNTTAFHIQTSCLNDISIYHSRVKKVMFLATTVHPSFISSKAAACAMFKYLTGDNLPHGRCKGKDIAMQVAELALATQDFGIVQDLRELNGRPKNTSFDVFWSEIKSLLSFHARVDDRRHGKLQFYAFEFNVLFICAYIPFLCILIGYRRCVLPTGRNFCSRLKGTSSREA